MSAEPSEQKRLPVRGCLLVVVVVIAMVWGCSSLVFRDKPAPPVQEGSAKMFARDTCREAIKKQLKAPSTAEFTNEVETITSQSDAQYVVEVVGTVESANSVGGIAGADFTCEAQVPKVSEGGTVLAKVIKIQPR